MLPQPREQDQHFWGRAIEISEVLAKLSSNGLHPIPFRHCSSPKQMRQAGGECRAVDLVCGDLANGSVSALDGD